MNSVARGDINASSIGSSEFELAFRWGSDAEICACKFCKCCCSRMLGEEILPRSLGKRLGAVVEEDDVSVSSDGGGLGFDRSDIDLRGESSCRPTGPIPSCANKVDLSKGFVLNSDVVGDMMPKLSAASKSGEGCNGVRWNSSCRGEVMASVGVVCSGSSRFSSNLNPCFLGCLGAADSGSTMLSMGTTGTIRP